MTDLRIISPCVRICTLNRDDICIGCGRDMDEIKAWSRMTMAEREAGVARADERLRQLRAR
jgi:predicted Fe-S protein YdhL (DUF1289 family)